MLPISQVCHAALVPSEVSTASSLWFLADSGALGYRRPPDEERPVSGTRIRAAGPVGSNGEPVVFLPGGSPLSTVDAAAMIRGGRVDVAVLEAAQVTPGGDFTHWTTAKTPGLFAPASAVDWASGARRVIAMLPHTSPDGASNLVSQSQWPLDGIGCVDLIVTDIAVIRVTQGGLVLEEVASGWNADNVAALTEAPLEFSPNLKEVTFEAWLASRLPSYMRRANKRCRTYPAGPP